MNRDLFSGYKEPMNPSDRIEQLIAKLTDWRGKTLAGVRQTILEADPEIIEEWKWMGSPVWSRDGIIAVGNAHKDKVKLTFDCGAMLPDPDKLFNAGLEGNRRRAIDWFEGDKINARALKDLVRAAVEYNQRKSRTGKRSLPAFKRTGKRSLAAFKKKKAPVSTRAKVRKSQKKQRDRA